MVRGGMRRARGETGQFSAEPCFSKCTWWVEESVKHLLWQVLPQVPISATETSELGEGIPTWAQTHSVLQLSPRPPPQEPFNEGWHLAEAGIEARPLTAPVPVEGFRHLRSTRSAICFLPYLPCTHRGWRLQLVTGRDATCGWRPWVSHPQSLVEGRTGMLSTAQDPSWAGHFMCSLHRRCSGQKRVNSWWAPTRRWS